MTKKTVFLVMVALLVGLSMEIYAQGTNSNWRPPPGPQWYRNLSQTEQNVLWEIAFSSSSITMVTLRPSLVRLETRKIIDEYGMAWAYKEDDQNVFSVIIRNDYGQFIQIMISRYWLNNLR